MKNVKRIERGWPAHFCGGSNCVFHRNTLLERGNKRIVVSTVGKYVPLGQGKFETIGINRYFETMAFWACFEGGYWEADVSKEIQFDSRWTIDHTGQNCDNEADAMHDDVVNEIANNPLHWNPKEQ